MPGKFKLILGFAVLALACQTVMSGPDETFETFK